MGWTTKKLVSRMPDLHDAILIEGLPGIGNVGKVAADFLVDELKAEKLLRFDSHSLPNSVFVNEENLVELPMIELYYKKRGKKLKDLLILVGDVQPVDEVASYEFSHKVLEIAKQLHCSEIITLGGIGLPNIPKEPKVYCTGNTKDIVKRYKKDTNVNDNLYGVVGPIVGVSGLLVGLPDKNDTQSIALLAETLGHPMYLGIKGAREILKVLNKKLLLKINLKDLDKDIMTAEKELMKRSRELGDLPKRLKGIRKFKKGFEGEVIYIG